MFIIALLLIYNFNREGFWKLLAREILAIVLHGGDSDGSSMPIKQRS